MVVRPINLPLSQVAELCKEYGVKKLFVFGSFLREDFSLDSDVDFLVEFGTGDFGPWLSKLTEFQDALARLLGRQIDVVPKENLKWAIRDRVLQSAQVVYATEE